MAVTLRVELDDIGAIAAMDHAAHRGEDMSDLMDQIGVVLVSGAVERIGITNVSPDGVPWPKSLRATLAQGGPTLHDSGRLMRSITHLPASREVEIGSNLIYAGVHQTGATIRAKTAKGLSFTLASGDRVVVGSVTLPPRPYLGISDEEADEIEGLAAAWFGEPMEAT